ncbi:shikimate kinase [Maritalea sp.]|uniref:shikimate kinase n=1 Tax=Maritalea sp. TaxID=2003361 RepID=UPI003EF9C32E
MQPIPPHQLQQRLSHIYWIGGGSGAGKSTIAKQLADQFDLQLYDTDAAMQNHAARSSSKDCPLIHEFLNMSMDERWVNRTPREMLKSFHWYKGEGFNFVIDDLLALPADRAVIAEGFRLLPELVTPYLKSKSQAIWLLPTAEFRKMAFSNRGSLWEIPNSTSNPQVALDNLLERDGIFTDQLSQNVEANKLNAIEVNQQLPQKDILEQVQDLFRL